MSLSLRVKEYRLTYDPGCEYHLCQLLSRVIGQFLSVSLFFCETGLAVEPTLLDWDNI